jgi:hypothetical protein
MVEDIGWYETSNNASNLQQASTYCTHPHRAPRNRSSSSALDGDVAEACAAVENGMLEAAATIPLAFLEKKENNTIQRNSINFLKDINSLVDDVRERLGDAL